MNRNKTHDIIVIGAGHAGLEAALICAKKNLDVILVVLNKELIGNMPCNPSIGGPAKGIVTREIDILGGMQGIAADNTQLQMKILNLSKGAGVWALRAQSDKIKYKEFFQQKIKDNKNIFLIEEEASDLIIENNEVKGIVLKSNQKIYAKKTIITAGTFFNSLVHIGQTKKKEGPDGFENSTNLAKTLLKHDIKIFRFKTGTPPRIDKNTIDYSQLQIETGTNKKLCFSHNDKKYLPIEDQSVCYLTYTNDKTHEIIKKNLHLSPMYNGSIKSIGPRYCPSIEDKVVRFADKNRHQIFVEPESIFLDTMYLAGFSSSMPIEVQKQMIQSLPGFEKAKIIKYAYAIEYDVIDSIQLYPTLEIKQIRNLFFAGQINGTSGYEEAACQGLIAGINAFLQIENKPPFILKRSESYIGVLIDDIVTKQLSEPYRLLTSRAEHRLELRNDNADDRLIKYAYELGTIDKKQYDTYLKNKTNLDYVLDYLKRTKINKIKDLNIDFKNKNISLYELLKKQEYNYEIIEPFLKFDYEIQFDDDWKQKIDILIKFEGYIKAQNKLIKEKETFTNFKLSPNINYKNIDNISLEAQDKLNKIKPFSLEQASRISGINLSDLINIKMYIDKNKKLNQN